MVVLVQWQGSSTDGPVQTLLFETIYRSSQLTNIPASSIEMYTYLYFEQGEALDSPLQTCLCSNPPTSAH